METPAIETANDQLVGQKLDGHVVIMRPNRFMSTEEALRLAAWLVVVVGDDERFAKIVQAIRGT